MLWGMMEHFLQFTELNVMGFIFDYEPTSEQFG